MTAPQPVPAASPVLKCCPCLDNLLTGAKNAGKVADAVTMAPSVQQFTINGQQVAMPVVLPVCEACRRRQLGIASKNGLFVA